MRIIGIDPGIGITGYGIVEPQQGNLKLLRGGVIATSARKAFAQRLAKIHHGLMQIIQEYQPQAMAVEDIFLGDNVQTALKLGQARGVALLAAAEQEIPVFAYSALQVKKAVVGYGKAEKRQVAVMVARVLNISLPLAADEADALAVAICHLHSNRLKDLLAQRGH